MVVNNFPSRIGIFRYFFVKSKRNQILFHKKKDIASLQDGRILRGRVQELREVANLIIGLRRFTMLIERREVNVNPHSVYLDARVIASRRAFYARHVASLQKEDVMRAM